MFWSKNRKKVYPCKPQFYYIKVGCSGYSLHGLVFVNDGYYIDLLIKRKNILSRVLMFDKHSKFMLSCEGIQWGLSIFT